MAFNQAPSFFKRLFSSLISQKLVLEHLKERSVIQVKGPEASDFLQGLITNDIHHLQDGIGSMYAVFLNLKGRILYDTLIYKTEEKDTYMIECDSKASNALQKHIKMYRVKRKLDVNVLNSFKVYVLYTSFIQHTSKNKQVPINVGHPMKHFPESSTDMKLFKNHLIFKDPRVAQLGYRIISQNDQNILSSLNELIECDLDNTDGYKELRYTLGIGEGTDDLLIGNSFPLECNCDYLHGISFHKGCYIGQELTARTYHTGVIRKRLMPIFFSKIPTSLPVNNSIIHNDTNLGKLRGIKGNVGLALLRVNQALEFGTIYVGNGEATVVKPEWWPVEMPKEKLNTSVTP